MHYEILHKNQSELLPYLKKFNRSFYLVGGTAIALHVGHRRSIDFDLFCLKSINKSRLKKQLLDIPFPQQPIFEDVDQLHLMINHVKVTFFNYPYEINHLIWIESYITIPELIELAAMKAFALGRRAKWKDYVDIYIMLRDHFTIKEISRNAYELFPTQFNEKLFREQLAFHKDIDYSEPVEYLIPPLNENEVREFLIEKAIDFL
jgi:hypothetical protein